MAPDLDGLFEEAGCTGSLHVLRLSDGAEVAMRAEETWLAASVIKVPIALAFWVQVEEGRLDPSLPVSFDPALRTPGPTGISLAVDPVTMSLRDLCTAMLAVSDNAATDAVLAAVGLTAVNELLGRLGCGDTTLVSSVGESLDGFAREMGFSDYSTLFRAQLGELGPELQVQATDQGRIGKTEVVDPARASRTTARDMTRLLGEIWGDRAGPPAGCAEVRRVMALQLTRRLGVAVPVGGSLAAKTGALFGRVRNEVGVIGTPAGEHYAVAVLTRPHRPFAGVPGIDQAMGLAVKAAIGTLEGDGRAPGSEKARPRPS